MRRWIAVLWHASFFVLAGALYFFFVLPRWFELTGAWPVGLGLAMRIACGALIGLAALPVVFTLLRTRRPEFGTPQLALSLRSWSIVLHVLAGALIVGAAISENWVSLDSAGQTLFAIYGAAAAVAILGALAFYLAYVAELPPPPPKPLRPKTQTRRRGGAARGDEGAEGDKNAEVETDASDDVIDADGSETADTDSDQDATEDVIPAPVTLEKPDDTSESPEAGEATEATGTPEIPEAPEAAGATETSAAEGVGADGIGNAQDHETDESDSRLRNRRPNGKSTSRLFGRSRRGVALED
ncbi:hypothetical protein [Mycolicibacterium hodleri]|uniref:Transmembrane protein n=1 Tax=Mycolicibacterium hodleri TaxID=49897 RepID=A0A502DZ83_9MYCO|nr:hypothetical protein [Mycolicibacterium hodleri]TPG29470.1 hypothetical protein EAH80_26880 [Mycolicibacterium hodleri]